jgi:CspA family cold shock protein
LDPAALDIFRVKAYLDVVVVWPDLWGPPRFNLDARSVFFPKIEKNRASCASGAAGALSCHERTEMLQGTVKFYNDHKGYGFIQPDNGGKDVFVHASALERAGMRGLVEGQKVSFEIETDRRTGKQSAGNLQAA